MESPQQESPQADTSTEKRNIFQRTYARSEKYVRKNPRTAAIIVGSIALLILGFILDRWITPVAPPHVSLSGEPIFSEGPAWLTNTIVTVVIVDIVLILMAVLATARMKEVPSGWQNAMEAVVEYLYSLAESVAGKDARRYFPIVTTIFFFVIISNWSGLIPGVGSIGFYHPAEHEEEATAQALALGNQLAMADGNLVLVQPSAADTAVADAALVAAEEEGHEKFVPLFRAPSADLNVTFALALSTMFLVQVWGVRALGGKYFKKFFNASGHGFMKGINIFVGILELISEFARIIAFGFRLFGNIFAGEIVLATMAFLVMFLLPVPFYMLEVFVGFVQALVFMMLALVFFSMSTISHEHDGH